MPNTTVTKYIYRIFVLMFENMVDIFETQKGYLLSKQLTSRAQRYHLKNMVEMGLVVMIKRGLYKHVTIASDDDWSEVCRIVPAGVLCLYSAWHYYGLTTHIPSEYHLAIPNKSKIVPPQFPPIKLYYWTNNYYSLGIEVMGKTTIYGLEKSVCDAIKFRNKVGKDIAMEVLKNYLKLNNRNIDLLLKYAKSVRVEKVLMQYLEIML
jgi:hypothetical protein